MRTAELHQTRLPALLTEVLKKVAKDPVYFMRTGHAYFGPTYICPRVYVIGFSECWPYIFRLKHVHPRVLDCVPCLSRHVLLSDCVAWSNEFFKHWMQNAPFSKVDFKPATLICPVPLMQRHLWSWWSFTTSWKNQRGCWLLCTGMHVCCQRIGLSSYRHLDKDAGISRLANICIKVKHLFQLPLWAMQGPDRLNKQQLLSIFSPSFVF